MKVFIDTNIFLDLILKREYYQEAMLIFNAIEKQLFIGYIADITILNIDYIAKKQIKNIKEFLSIVNQTFVINGASNDMIDQALKIQNNDLEDNIQYLIAKQNNCDVIVTNDQNFYSKDIKTINSIEFKQRYITPFTNS